MGASDWNTAELIEAAKKNSHKFAFNHHDREDAEQDFILGVLLAQKEVDKERKGAATFIWSYAYGYVKKGIRHRIPAKVSLSQEISDNTELGDIFGVEDSRFLTIEFQEIVKEILDTLPERERQILILHAVYNVTYREIGEEFGYSAQGIEQIYKKTCSDLQVRFQRYKEF